MSDDQKRIELIRMVLGKAWEPHVPYPATFHNRRRVNVAGTTGGLSTLTLSCPVTQSQSQSEPSEHIELVVHGCPRLLAEAAATKGTLFSEPWPSPEDASMPQ